MAHECPGCWLPCYCDDEDTCGWPYEVLCIHECQPVADEDDDALAGEG